MLSANPEPPGRLPQYNAINARSSRERQSAIFFSPSGRCRYISTPLPACRVAWGQRARAIRRDEYVAFSAYAHCPKNVQMR